MDAREKRLIKRLRRRDERAFREMVLTYQQPVFNLIYRLLGNEQEAEDVAQEVFISVFKAIDGFRGDAKLSTWLYRIATNHCRNRFKYMRRRQYGQQRPFVDAASGETASDIALQGKVDRPDEMFAGRELEHHLKIALGRLDEEHRVAIVLRDIQGLSYEEIATVTGVARGTVKSRLHRGRVALKDLLRRVTDES